MKTLLMYLCGYRKYKFRLFTGKTVTFWAQNKGQAIQKALNLERRIREHQEKTIKTLAEQADNGLRDVPGKRGRDIA